MEGSSREDCTPAEATQMSIVVAPDEGSYTIEEALVYIGHGWMQRLLLIVLGAACATFSANVVLMSFLEPNVKCEWHLEKTQETILSVVVLLGMIIGSNLWGTVADRYGRKYGAGLSLAVEGIGGIVASTARNYKMLLICRGVVGIGVGGLATSFSTYSEFLPTDVRGYNLCWYQMFWATGGVLEVVVAWIIVPKYDWRVLSLTTALPALVLLPVIALLPESPRYLAVSGRYDRVLRVLKRIADVNGASLPRGRIKLCSEYGTENTSRASVCKQLSRLFSTPLRTVTPMVWFLSFTLGVGYYAMVILAATVRTDGSEDTCQGKKSDVGNSDYFSILVDALAELPGVILALFTIERLGRVKSMILSWCACWMAMVLLILFPAEKTIFLFIGRLFTAYTDIFIFVLTPELYPSSCRCFAMGTMSAISQVGGVASPFIARAAYQSYGLRVVSCLCGILFLGADIVTFFLLPYETSGSVMKDDFSELRHVSVSVDCQQPLTND